MSKLSNGEDIIAGVEPIDSGKFKLTAPLKMRTVTKTTETGMVESLGLARWVQVYSDEPYYNIEKNSVVLMTPASEGLCRYYEYVLKSMHQTEMKSPTDQESSWNDIAGGTIPAEMLSRIRIDTYVSPSGQGFVVIAEKIIDGKTYSKSYNVGPELERSTEWIVISEE